MKPNFIIRLHPSILLPASNSRGRRSIIIRLLLSASHLHRPSRRHIISSYCVVQPLPNCKVLPDRPIRPKIASWPLAYHIVVHPTKPLDFQRQSSVLSYQLQQRTSTLSPLPWPSTLTANHRSSTHTLYLPQPVPSKQNRGIIKMPPASNEEQFKFLISCIRWSNSGKVIFIAISTRHQTDISRSISEKSPRNVALSRRVLRKSMNSSFPSDIHIFLFICCSDSPSPLMFRDHFLM